ncbi:hypothetical protein N658DRAFT_460013 [Parathielavia hyrcaniae]|uniref:Uncharacterized protein n=1 Tax=Parathielavia hyrcaniae TaxID=113614 RepID=A0AAN6Q9A5_9PEZI|nr:hypothetical protein N658DRAFT_460013 [Parathielavia hyrcaniae]
MSSQPTAAVSVPFTIENALPGPLAFGDSPDLYRIRLHPEHSAGGPTIKYLTAPNSSRIFTGPDAHFRRFNNLPFDSVPAGDWIVGRLVIAEEGDSDASQRGKLKLASTEPAGAETADILNHLGLCSAEPLWCSTTIDEADCQLPRPTSDWTTVITADGNEVNIPKPTDLECMDYVSASVIPAPTTGNVMTGHAQEVSVVRVLDWLPGHWVGIERDTRAHQIIQARDPGLAPRFLAHVTENGSRVIGFLLEHIPDAREAGPKDLEKCRAALARLPTLGIAKGRELKRHSFLVKTDGSVVIRGPFTYNDVPAEESVDELGEVMEAELDSIETVLAQSPSEFEEQPARMLRLVDPRRTKMLDEFERAHGLVVPFVYWQESSEGGGRITLTVEEHGVMAREFEKNGFRWTSELQQRAEERFGPKRSPQ